MPIIATADCIPLFVYDCSTQYFGLIHCGWRGIVSGVHTKALHDLINRGCSLNNLKVYIGPSIRECCYVIGAEVVECFSSQSINKSNDKIYLDLINEIKIGLLNIGILSGNIIESKICTYENNECYSYRKENGSNGRMYSMIIKL